MTNEFWIMVVAIISIILLVLAFWKAEIFAYGLIFSLVLVLSVIAILFIYSSLSGESPQIEGILPLWMPLLSMGERCVAMFFGAVITFFATLLAYLPIDHTLFGWDVNHPKKRKVIVDGTKLKLN